MYAAQLVSVCHMWPYCESKGLAGRTSESKSKSRAFKSKSKFLEPKSKSSKNGLKSGLESKSGLEYYKSAQRSKLQGHAISLNRLVPMLYLCYLWPVAGRGIPCRANPAVTLLVIYYLLMVLQCFHTFSNWSAKNSSTANIKGFPLEDLTFSNLKQYAS